MINLSYTSIIYRSFLSIFLILFCISIANSQGLTIKLESSWSDYGEISNATVSYVGEVTPGAVIKTLSEERKTLNYIGNGTYTLSNTPENILSSQFKIEIFEANHAPRTVQLSYKNVMSIPLDHNNYYQRCKEEYSPESNNNSIFQIQNVSGWQNCQEVNPDQLIETFGRNIEPGLIKFINNTYLNSLSLDLDDSFDDKTYIKYENGSKISFDPISIRQMRYASLLNNLLKSYAAKHSHKYYGNLVNELELKIEKSNDAILAQELTKVIANFHPDYQLIESGLDLSIGALYLEKSMYQEEIDAILLFLAYQKIGNTFFERLQLLHSNSPIADDVAFTRALSQVEINFNNKKKEDLNSFVKNYKAGRALSILGEIVLDKAITTALSKAGISTYALLVGAVTTPAVITIGIKVVVAHVIWDYVSSSAKLAEKKALLRATAHLNEYLIGHIPNSISKLKSINKYDEMDLSLKLLLALYFNESRAAIYSGVYASWLEYLIKYKNMIPDSPQQAYEFKMVEVSNEKKNEIGNLLEQLIEDRPTIEIREKELNICDVWSVANSGGVEGTIDRWNISELPEGVMLDIRYDTKSIPDKLLIEYPENNEQLDTGWRGDRRYSSQRYPGGIQGRGVGQNFDMFRKESDDTFVVKVNGVDDGTYWEYQVRCRVPESFIINETN